MFEEFQSAGSASEAVGEEDPSVRLRALVMRFVRFSRSRCGLFCRAFFTLSVLSVLL